MVRFENDVWLIEVNENKGFALLTNKRLAAEGKNEPFVKVNSKDEIKTIKIKGVKIPNYIKSRLEPILVQLFSKMKRG